MNERAGGMRRGVKMLSKNVVRKNKGMKLRGGSVRRLVFEWVEKKYGVSVWVLHSGS
jgi:hypothetical protein